MTRIWRIDADFTRTHEKKSVLNPLHPRESVFYQVIRECKKLLKCVKYHKNQCIILF